MIDVFVLDGNKRPEKIMELNTTLPKATEKVASIFNEIKHIRHYQNRSFLYLNGKSNERIMLTRRINHEITV
jgi:hypothetical protein